MACTCVSWFRCLSARAVQNKLPTLYPCRSPFNNLIDMALPAISFCCCCPLLLFPYCCCSLPADVPFLLLFLPAAVPCCCPLLVTFFASAFLRLFHAAATMKNCILPQRAQGILHHTSVRVICNIAAFWFWWVDLSRVCWLPSDSACACSGLTSCGRLNTSAQYESKPHTPVIWVTLKKPLTGCFLTYK